MCAERLSVYISILNSRISKLFVDQRMRIQCTCTILTLASRDVNREEKTKSKGLYSFRNGLRKGTMVKKRRESDRLRRESERGEARLHRKRTRQEEDWLQSLISKEKQVWKE